VAAATATVESAPLAVVATNAFAVVTALDVVAVAGGGVTLVTTFRAPTEVVGDDGVVTAFSVAECVEFESDSTGVDVGCSVSGAGVAGGVLASGSSSVSPAAAGSPDSGDAVAASDSVGLVCAPPLLPTVTPGATSADEDVVPDVIGLSAAVVGPVLVEIDPLVDVEPPPVVVAVDEVAVPVVDVGADPVDDSPVDVELAELVDDSEDEAPVSAEANP